MNWLNCLSNWVDLPYKPNLTLEVGLFLVSIAKHWRQLVLLQGILKERTSGQQMVPAASRVLPPYPLFGAREPQVTTLLAG